MKRYLIALDMDGTLLNDEKDITPLTKKALITLKNMGHKIVFASGRPYRTMLRYYEELDIDTPVIAYNGGAIYGLKSSYPDIETTFPLSDVLAIYNQYGIENLENTICETAKEVYLLHDDETFTTWFNYTHLEKHIGDLNETLNVDPMTMLFHFKGKNDMEELNQIASKVNPELFVRSWSGGEFAELSYKKVSKYHALRDIASFYHIPNTRIIAFGDAGNDIETLSNVGVSVAMKNGTEHTLEKAMHVTKEDNNHDGIALFLNEFFNLND